MIKQILKANPVREGAGVTVHRTIGTPGLKNLDPFLMLDHFGSDQPDQYIAGFPDHPHRGFNTFTYMIDGHMQHRDSMGNEGDLLPGGVQWMKAGSGVIHSEMPQQTQGLMRGFQLWINLPADQKMTDPAYQEYAAEQLPRFEFQGADHRLLVGNYHGHSSPVQDANTSACYLDVSIPEGQQYQMDLVADHNHFIYLFEGSATISGQSIPEHSLAVLDTEQNECTLTAGEAGARLISVSGQPIGESVVQYGPFVMNTMDEINQAMLDYQAGRLVQTRAEMRTD